MAQVSYITQAYAQDWSFILWSAGLHINLLARLLGMRCGLAPGALDAAPTLYTAVLAASATPELAAAPARHLQCIPCLSCTWLWLWP
jgi:hypothetical protein